ncbi:recombination regulator RecX [Peptacetobacter hominis]|uniref:Regulatory protein RecX n=1 Tax=Peptacetobacter hominis TaxID=2743610 RepID=A0A544QY25_9FIRM|nr:recombination regulator RecX [Peptacetobacter hominis]TQQ85647.1 recombination regulator RecX [Peptacetobacter hominis]
MSIITKIEAQKRNSDRVNIYVDDEYFMSVYTELVFTHSLKKGMEIDKDSLNSILEAEMYLKAKEKALSILSKADQSEKIIYEKLMKNFDEPIVEKVMEFLKKHKLIDDSSLAERIANDNINLSKFGRNKVRQNLYMKGIDSNIIENVVSDIDSDTEFENAMYLAEKRMKRLENESRDKAYRKLYQHLSYKGFGYDTIKKVMNRFFNSCDFDNY